MAETSSSAVDSLASKIQALELTDDEVAVLDALLSAAEAGAEVDGFEFKPKISTFALPELRTRLSIFHEHQNPRRVVINHEEQ